MQKYFVYTFIFIDCYLDIHFRFFRLIFSLNYPIFDNIVSQILLIVHKVNSFQYFFTLEQSDNS